jgi:hypothetical protein
MSEMVQRVAQAIAAKSLDEGDGLYDWHALVEAVQDEFYAQAREAIAAMQTPTSKMLEAGRIPTREIELGNGTTTEGLGFGASPDFVYRNMMRAALTS